MAANIDKVEEKAEEELLEKIKSDKSISQIEKELNTHDVAYKIKDYHDKK
jgi:hypothetical protein